MNDSEGTGIGPGPRPYLSAGQLTQLTPWSRNAIQKLIAGGVLLRGVHFFQPFGRRGRLIFKWAAITALIEGQALPDALPARKQATPPSQAARTQRVIDVEKAQTELQRLLA